MKTVTQASEQVTNKQSKMTTRSKVTCLTRTITNLVDNGPQNTGSVNNNNAQSPASSVLLTSAL